MIDKFVALIRFRRVKAEKEGTLLSLVRVFRIILNKLEGHIREYDFRKRNLPSILLITLPKSGSMFILHSLMGICRSRPLLTGDHGFPFGSIDGDGLKLFAKGCAIDQGHYMPSSKNLFLLKREGIDKVVVHVRDPRQALLSWVHYVDKLHKNNIVFTELDIELPLDYFDKSLEDKIDVMIESWYPHLINFVDGWLRYRREGVSRWGVEVLITEFKKMKNEPGLLFEDIFNFYNIDQSKFPSETINHKGTHSHFRKGESDEWNGVFSAEQVRRTSESITDEMYEEFGWTRI
ncbi:MAG: hypothetical protein COS82_06775 [Zetaproteobacteria bacterium CG06_land_8_20_14_3_00_59_53]|nr:MAG: hypothetical protein AUK36_03700 [Zetaproteobacteria bacterium CG2_30_59_37]PIO89905.1 MAG: hypothetical protein COX56_05890 [Zetaproteobacteria bacterium CG23_combo_of_CG06-09_8_20_14_all_59_86]PIQ64271.1 MAG: hypothetical protein COV97_10145 [Zetaproteobacteria bacterium CG11_big_fil_rev_8_21_14_0_20_59_439]PIU70383.1 MAG: hypothetical protein COS82_06775 [Zetaproteobacteria bacterium CG06_land_8_20_14_3_00_59_53]PIU97493.1 MAG: hypothetical protein COS62_03770 [Zetaproteobacteria bac